MNWVDLGEPTPRQSPQTYSPLIWPQGVSRPLPRHIPQTRSFSEVARSRRTHRAFAPLDYDSLGALLALTCRTQRVATNEHGQCIELRPCPSAGALHPIHLVFADASSSIWRRYDPRAHSLVDVASPLAPTLALDTLRDFIDPKGATLLLLAAERDKTNSKYSSPESLIWRDSGVILGTMSLAAESLNLSFCPLGTTGHRWVSALLEKPGLVGVGAAFLGATPT